VRAVVALLMLALLSSSAFAAVQFNGIWSNSGPGSTGLGWSSDLGPPPKCNMAAEPLGANGFRDSCSNYSLVSNGDVGAFVRLTVAGAGLASLAAPVLQMRGHVWASSPNDYYGRFGGANTAVTLYLGPTVPPGGDVYWAVRWHSARSGNLASATWAVRIGGSFYSDVVASQDSAANGVTYGVCGTRYNPPTFDFESGGGLGSGSGVVMDQDVTVDVFIDSVPIAGLGEAPAPTALEFSAPGPNPTHGVTMFGFALPERGEVAVNIVDVSGRTVRELHPGELAAGRHEVRWDGHGSNGTRVAPGVYWAKLSWSGRSRPVERQQRLVVLD
jgi:hypothetical protein